MELDKRRKIQFLISALSKNFEIIILFISIGILLMGMGVIIDKSKHELIGSFLLAVGSTVLATGLIPLAFEIVTDSKLFDILNIYGDNIQHGIKRIYTSSNSQEFKEQRDKAFAQAHEIKILSLIGREWLKTYQNQTARGHPTLKGWGMLRAARTPG